MQYEHERLIAAYAAAKAQVERDQAKLRGIADDLIDYMQVKGRKTLKTSKDGYLLQATYSRRTSVVVDEKGLRKRLGAPVYDKYTKRVLDKRLLEEGLERGEVDRVTVTPFITTKHSEPFIVFTTKEDRREVPEPHEV